MTAEFMCNIARQTLNRISLSRNSISLVLAVIAVATVAFTVVAKPVAAQNHLETSARFIAGVTDEAINALTSKGLSESQLEERLRSVLVDNLAVNNIGRIVLGRYWTGSSDQEKREFIQLFQDVTVRAWGGRLGELGGQRFTVVSASNLDNPNPDIRFALVRSTFGSGGDQLPVDWQVAESNSILKVTDVFVSGISLVQAQKDEFEAVLRQNGGSVAALNDMLRERQIASN
jgi:phospholipid transport system substrate-binding protein